MSALLEEPAAPTVAHPAPAYATTPVDALDEHGRWAGSFRYEPFLDRWFLARPSDAAKLSLFRTPEVPEAVLRAATRQTEAPWTQAAYRAPLKAQIQLNRNCNYSCSICYANSMKGRNDYALSLAELDGLFKYLKHWGVLRVNFVGGEVFMRSDFTEVVELAHHHRLLTSCITNGRIPGSKIEQYHDLLHSMFNVQISCNGFGASYENEYGARDWNVARKCIENVVHATKANILSYVIKTENVEDIPNFLAFAATIRPKQVKFGSVCWSGRAQKEAGVAYYQSTVPRARALIEIGRRQHPDLNIQSQLDLGSDMPAWEEFSNDYRPFEFYFAPEGRDGLYIHASGDVYPFPLLSETGAYRLGNIRTDDLRQVWADNPDLQQIRSVSFRSSACGKVGCSRVCGLWSRSYAIAWSGRVDGKVPCAVTKWQ
ncbi:radical SAM protein [Aurantimonas sp. MSK8Z-1]|uniref:radical SAM protein n=1 Tax=Mangrovibrevibacter kandeliae TaxID=2968473 RepID=UPI00211769A2|nr:radical SAM protein [Aurantimonas sp. MSK8Z-1]MCW4116400.1 radical SAM protein [Aurantimonas sp. MSK8Z-1]